MCDFQCFVHHHYRQQQKIKVKKKTKKIRYTKLYNTSTTYPVPRLRGGHAPIQNNNTVIKVNDRGSNLKN